MKKLHLKRDCGCIWMNIGDGLFTLIPVQVSHSRKCEVSEEDPAWFASAV